MKILAIDTSSKICSVSILQEDILLIEKHINDEKTHSQKLMPLIDKILKECNITLKEIDVLACCVGPGSFTGVRIGISTVKAFYDVNKTPLVSVNSLESLAYNSLNSNFLNNKQFICSIIDAKNDNVYFGIFKQKNGHFTPLEDICAKNINEILEVLKKYSNKEILFIGDGAVVHKYSILQKFSNCTFIEDKLNYQTSVSVRKMCL